ncbi:hypothetical protein BA062_32475 [Prauserella flavalba]|uniref:Uncharacterized protein n=1 Tax=Prauserella flavalba TaxID=1477506 RepID=A0A318LBP3_9PSEU|nr:hypothetical protein BA062_32475 [Prauserella flavalba]
MASGVALLTMAGALVLLGRWGRRNANRVPPWLSSRERERRSRTMRRGARACYVVAAVLTVAGLGTLIPVGY